MLTYCGLQEREDSGVEREGDLSLKMESKNGVESVGGGCRAKAHIEGGEQQQDATSPRRVLSHELLEVATAGSHFTCFTGTKVQIPPQKALRQLLGSLTVRLSCVYPRQGGLLVPGVPILAHLLVQKYKY